jgi:hypothetical protein
VILKPGQTHPNYKLYLPRGKNHPPGPLPDASHRVGGEKLFRRYFSPRFTLTGCFLTGCYETVKVFPDLPDNPPQVLIKKRPIQYPWGLSDPKFEFFHSLYAIAMTGKYRKMVF